MKRNPLLAALLNVLLCGLGYVYLGKRMAFGILLIFANITAVTFFVSNFREINFNILINPLAFISLFLFLFAVGYDAYTEGALEKKKEDKVENEI